MGGDDRFSNVGANITKGNLDAAVAEIITIAESFPRDVGTLLSCASVLKAIGEADGFDKVVDMILDASTTADPYDIATSLSGLGLYGEALIVLEGSENPAAIPILYATALLAVGRAAEAVDVLSDGNLGIEESIVLSEALCAVGRHEEAVSLTKTLVSEGGGWPAMKAYCAALMHGGDNKGAFKYARKAMKEVGAADSNALAAYVMRINGRIPAAAGYAARALKADAHHLGALEEMAMCLLEKGEVDRARFFAGAINDVSPGHPATVRILDACPRR